ncbi:MAG: hypothetical protein CVV16_03375 [Gammaproteobacteria bacterium HGW-Gammaproteobacteria-6]|nr:MAG: hypothetical protein CVV16_03375 [Gammaproteobacteria bacterium HGW-Gammaproteobacteria-6]
MQVVSKVLQSLHELPVFQLFLGGLWAALHWLNLLMFRLCNWTLRIKFRFMLVGDWPLTILPCNIIQGSFVGLAQEHKLFRALFRMSVLE